MSDRNRRVAIAAVAGGLQRAIAVLGTYLMFPRVLHSVGTEQFGLWGAATSLSLLFAMADFGVGPAIVTLVSNALATAEVDEPRRHFTAGLMMACLVALFIAVAGVAVVLTAVPAPQVQAYLIAVLGVAISVPFGAGSPAWLALQRGWMVAFCEVLQTGLVIAGLFLASHYTTDVRVYIAIVYLSFTVANAINLALLLAFHPEIRPETWRVPLADLSLVMRTGLRYFVLSTLDAFSYMLDNIIALQLLGAAAAAQMTVVQRICVAAIGLLMVVSQPLWPAFVEAAARGDRRWIYTALLRGSLLVTGAAVAGSSIVVLFGQTLLRLWLKTNVGIDQSLLWVMGIWIVSLSLTRVQTLLLNALQIMRFQMVLLTATTVISFTLKFLLAPRFGIAGIMIATAVTVPLITLPAMVWRIRGWRLAPAAAGLATS